MEAIAGLYSFSLRGYIYPVPVLLFRVHNISGNHGICILVDGINVKLLVSLVFIQTGFETHDNVTGNQDTRYKKLYLKSALNFNISNISH